MGWPASKANGNCQVPTHGNGQTEASKRSAASAVFTTGTRFDRKGSWIELDQCLECGATPPAAKLKQCARCRKVWFCSKECQAKSWKEDHQHLCDPQSGVTICGDSDRADMEADFKELGGVIFSFSSKPVGQPRALLRDSIISRFLLFAVRQLGILQSPYGKASG